MERLMKKIMIVDDDQHISDMLVENLSTEGYDVVAAYSGTEALLLLSSKCIKCMRCVQVCETVQSIT